MSDIEKNRELEFVESAEPVETTESPLDELAEFEAEGLDFADTEMSEAIEGNEVSLEDDISSSDELSAYESAEIEEEEFIENDRLLSIVESVLFASDRPVTLEAIKAVFKGTNIRTKDLRRAIDELAASYASPTRGVQLDEISGGYQIRTKTDNMNYLRRHVKGRAFKLSGPALEVLSIVAYKQPVAKFQVDEIRGVESGHLMRALMDRGLIRFGEKSDLPGKPMFYETTRKFLEIFGLRNISELPSLSEIDQLIPEGIGEVEVEKPKLSDLTGQLSVDESTQTYSQGEDELLKISDQLQAINTSSEFFEKEKERQKQKREFERAQDIREMMLLGKDVSDSDKRWLKKYDTKAQAESAAASVVVEGVMASESSESEASTGIVNEESVGAADEFKMDNAEEFSEALLSDDEILAKVEFLESDKEIE